jgi:hypothetical protein
LTAAKSPTPAVFTRPRAWLYLAATLMMAVACIVPPEIIQAVYRLPTPTPTGTGTPTSVLYVSKTGDDDNDCLTPATSCLTINAAVTKAPDGAAIHIGPGTYAENDVRGLDEAVAIRGKSLSLYGAEAATGYPTVITGSRGLHPLSVTGDVDVVVENVALIDGIWGLTVSGEANVTLRHTEIRNNSMVGIVMWGGSLLLEDVVLRNNPDGALNLGDGTRLTVRGGRIIGNGSRTREAATELGWPDTVIYNGGDLEISDTTIGDNDAAGTFVLWNAEGAAFTAENSTIGPNEGVAVYNAPGGAVTLRNSTVSGNVSGFQNLGDLALLFSTVAHNENSGVWANSGAVPSEIRFENSLIVNNGVQDCMFQLGHHITFDRRGRVISDRSCIFEYGGYVPSPLPEDDLLGPLADNGGPTRTHALFEGNSAIDASEGPCLAADQRGVGRPVGGGCDVGAYEFTFSLTAATPAATPVPLYTPTSPATETPPGVTLVQNANCRKGPSTAYSITTALELGVQTAAVGRDDPASWWLVKVPQTEMTCWVANTTVETSGDLLSLPVVPVDPVPGQPSNFEAGKATCSQNLNDYPVQLKWSDVSHETGYRLYRNGSQLTQLSANEIDYTDHAPKGPALTYEIEAFNSLGVSPRSSLDVPACK